MVHHIFRYRGGCDPMHHLRLQNTYNGRRPSSQVHGAVQKCSHLMGLPGQGRSIFAMRQVILCVVG